MLSTTDITYQSVSNHMAHALSGHPMISIDPHDTRNTGLEHYDTSGNPRRVARLKSGRRGRCVVARGTHGHHQGW